MSKIDRLKSSLKRCGPLVAARQTVHRFYAGRIRPLLPETQPAVYNGVPIAIHRRAGDSFFSQLLGPFGCNDNSGYEDTLLAGLKKYVRPGDTVVVVGGGVGVTTAVAGSMAGENGHVVCFEGSALHADLVRKTVALNGLAGRTEVRHAVVGPAIAVYGEIETDEQLQASELPPCDVLELDCEGSEVDILQNMTITPRVILVETHGIYGSSPELCRSLLEARGYQVTDLGVAEPQLAAFCEQADIRILAGERAAV